MRQTPVKVVGSKIAGLMIETSMARSLLICAVPIVTGLQSAVEGMEVSSDSKVSRNSRMNCQQKLRFLRNVLQNCPSVSRAKFFSLRNFWIPIPPFKQSHHSFNFMSGHEILFSGKVL